MQDIGSVLGRVKARGLGKPAKTSDSTALAVMPQTQALAIVGEDYSPTLEAAVDAVNGPLLKIEQEDPRALTNPIWKGAPPLVTYARAPLPEGAQHSRREIEQRIAAIDILMQPAPNSVRLDWSLALIQAMETKLEGEDLMAHAVGMAEDIDVPEFCLTQETKRVVMRRFGPWLPSYAKMASALIEPAAPLEQERTRLRNVLAALDVTAKQQGLLAAPSGPVERTAAEVEAWLIQTQGQPADAVRGAAARGYRARLTLEAPELAEKYAPMLAALAGEALTAEDAKAPPPAEPVPLPGVEDLVVVPIGDLRKAVKEGVRLTLPDDETLRAMTEAARQNVDLRDLRRSA